MKKQKSDNAYFFWSVALVVCAALAVFVLLYTSAVGNKKAAATASAVTSSTQTDSADTAATDSASAVTPAPAPASTVLSETEDMGSSYIDKMYFLGDSTTNGLAHYNIIPSERVWTPASGTLTLNLWSTATVSMTDGSEISIKDAVSQYKPEYLVITLGVNGVSFLDETNFKTEYTNLVNAVKEASPATKIILNSIYPVTSAYPASSGITNAKIDTANGWVQAVAESCGVAYTDSASALKDDGGALPDSLCNGDNLHLNTDGYNKVITYLRTHGWK